MVGNLRSGSTLAVNKLYAVYLYVQSYNRHGHLINSLSSFCIQVNGQNVVKVGHRQVVNMIRQGGNSLMVKVVMVTRNPGMEDGARKKSWFIFSRANCDAQDVGDFHCFN